MAQPDTLSDPLPDTVGVGFKPGHFSALQSDPGAVDWLEIHAENYMGDGGRPLAQLRELRADFPISLHGVGLSIGGSAGLDADHLARLKHLFDWLEPAAFSEHLAWSTHDGRFLNDLLPLPYTGATLAGVCDHIDQVHEVLGCRMLLENPSSYLAFATSTWDEPGFLAEVSRRTGCGLLLDVNNVFVSATNLGFSPQGYIDAYPTDKVGEIHLGGHQGARDDNGAEILIDNHAAPVGEPVWSLLDHALHRTGARPVLIEWDNDVPDWAILERQAARALAGLARAATGKGKS